MIFGFSLKKYFRHAYRSPQWSVIRKEHLKVYDVCAACGRNKKLEVHHIEPVHLNPDKELDPSNLITLCNDPCHLLFGHLMNYKSWNENVEKDCEAYYKKIQSRPYKRLS